MTRILPLLKTVGQAAQGLVLTSVFVMNALMGYIMFAPDDLPKPFYLSYAGDLPAAPTASASAASHGGESVAHAASDGAEVVRVYQPGQGMMVETGTKIVNLADPGGRRYLKATITIEVTPPATEAAGAETADGGGHGSGGESGEDPAVTAFNEAMNQRMPIINDIITTLLSGKTFESIYTVEGKEGLRREIQSQLNERLPDLQVIAVYFTEFVVQ